MLPTQYSTQYIHFPHTTYSCEGLDNLNPSFNLLNPPAFRSSFHRVIDISKHKRLYFLKDIILRPFAVSSDIFGVHKDITLLTTNDK